jgi:putative ABC transport system ATP-binding protein
MIAERVLHAENFGPAKAASTMVSLENVTKVFLSGKSQVSALKRVSLQVYTGEFLAITGPSGSGKTTLLNLIGCLDRPSSGQIEIEGEDVINFSSNALANLRARKMGLIFQSFNLIPVLTVCENVEYPLLISGSRLSATARRERVLDLLAQLEIEPLADRRPNELSGGECQRAAVARALITEPKIVLADEPTSNLDSKTGDSLLRMMKRLNEQSHITFIFSTHDARLVDLAGRVVELRDGEVIGDYVPLSGELCI